MESRVLVVDDEENIRFTFENFLTEEGYNVLTASNYNEALSLIDTCNFDLVFTDIILKGKNGIEILEAIRKRKMSCPVVMITGAPNVETATDALRLGAFDYISKPVLQDELLRIAKKALLRRVLAEKKERYHLNVEAIFRSVKDAIITVDQNMQVVEINDAAKRICNISSNYIDKKFYNIPKYCNKKCIDAIDETLTKKQSVEIYRFECKHKQHPQQVVTISTDPLINNKGLISGAVMVVREKPKKPEFDTNKTREQFYGIIGQSKNMQSVFSLIEDLANVDTTVLISGESGTGKELVADALHCCGRRNKKPLVKVNCSALSENLLESELFGHVKGAFTGADHETIGRFKKANGGTIFLDEIGDISHNIQLKLLRFLQEKEFEKVGDTTPIKVDVRVICATHRDLAAKVKSGEFREDLFYRLKVVEVRLPPLRERKGDIPLLINHFVDKLNSKFNKNIESLSSDVKRIFMEYSWPGNIRELKHTLEHAFITCHQSLVTVDHLPANLKTILDAKIVSFNNQSLGERQSIIQALDEVSWNKSKAAELLGISRRTLYRKINEFGIATKND